jgi:hypothetical protein
MWTFRYSTTLREQLFRLILVDLDELTKFMKDLVMPNKRLERDVLGDG